MSSNTRSTTIATIDVDLGKNTFHLVGLDRRGAIVLQLKLSRGQLERRLANVPRCLIRMEACSGSHHIGCRLTELGHDVRLIPAQYVKPFLKGHKNDYRDAEAIAEAVQRPTMRFVAIKTPEQMDLLALHRVRSRLVGQRTGVINQIRGFLIERGITARQGVLPLRKALPALFSSSTGTLSPRVVRLFADLAQDRHITVLRFASSGAKRADQKYWRPSLARNFGTIGAKFGEALSICEFASQVSDKRRTKAFCLNFQIRSSPRHKDGVYSVAQNCAIACGSVFQARGKCL